MIHVHNAILALAPNAHCSVINESVDNIIWNSPDIPQPTKEQILEKLAELQAAEPLRLLRLERNRLITATDWWVLPDRTPTQAQLDYRQALRDITTQTPALDEDGNLTGVVWPEKPSS